MADKKKRQVMKAPVPTYTKIDPKNNASYKPPAPAPRSNIVVSQEDLTPRVSAQQSFQPITNRGALGGSQTAKESVKVDLNSPASMTQTMYGIRDQMNAPTTDSKGMTIGLPVQPQTGYLMNNLQGAAPNVPRDQTRSEWIESEAKKRQENAPQSGLGHTLSSIAEPFAKGIDYLQAYTPGMSAFQKGAGAALGVGLDSPAPSSHSLLDKTAFGAGFLAGGATNPSALEQNLITTPYKAAGAIVNKLAPNAGKVANRFATGALAGVPTGAAYSLITGHTDTGDVLKNAALGGALGGAGDVAFGAVGSLINRMRSRGVPEEQIQEILALPMGREDAARLRRANQTQTPDVIHGNAGPQLRLPDGKPLGLPSPDIAPPTSARIQQRVNPYREQFEELIRRAHERQQAGGMTPGREDLELEQMWSSMAGREGKSLDELIDLAYPNRPSRVTPDSIQNARQYQAAREVAGAPMPVKSFADRYPQGGQTGIPEGPITVPARAPIAPPKPAKTRVSASSRQPIQNRGALSEVAAASETAPTAVNRVVAEAQTRAASSPEATPLTRPDVDDTAIVRGTIPDEPKFANTVRQSQNTSPELRNAINQAKMTAQRTTDQRNLELAEKLLNRDGIETAASKIIDKKGTLNAVENTAAQIIAKYYADTGQLERAIQVISKTTSSGRELGQAIQALTRWNKFTKEGALMMAERQLNRLTTKPEQWKSLTAKQGAPIVEAAQKLESVQAAQQLANDVTHMLSNRANGAAFTSEEKALIQQFSQQIRKTGEEIRPLVAKERAQANKDIAEVSRVKPVNRTRDQVQKLVSAQADKARERIAQSKNRLSSLPLDLWRDYIIIGADNLTKKIIKFTDWSKAMNKEGIDQNLGKLYTDSVKKFRRENGLPTSSELEQVINRSLKSKTVDEETANSLRAMASEISFFADDVKLEMTQELQRTMKSIGTSTLGEKISTVQTSFMLSSVPTFLRNTFGNWGQYGLEKIAKVAAVPIDWSLSKLTGERTIQFLPQNQEKYWRNYGTGTKSGWTGIDPQGQLEAYNLSPDVFKSNKNPFKWMVQLTGASLKGGDYASYMQAYGDVVATYGEQLGRARGLTRQQIKEQMPKLVKQLDDNIYAMADQAGLYATYQDETMLSKGALKLRKALNYPTDKLFRSARDKIGLSPHLSLEGFGAGDILLKFAKTPANLVMRGIDYSPIGFVRGIYELLPLVARGFGNKNAVFNQFQASRALGRATVGTLGLTGLGFYLAKEGILTGAASANPNIRSLEEQTGKGPYKANMSALTRFIMSGLDPEAAKYQQGDIMMDYNWVQPAAISISMGVNLAESLGKPDKPGANTPNWRRYAGAVTGGLRSVLENPLVTGLNNVVDATSKAITNQDTSGFTSIAQGVPASFVPAIAGQWRTGKDTSQRETFSDNPLTAMLNMIKNKLPGTSENLPQSYNSLGGERERYNYVEPNTLGSYLNSFLNPAKFSKYEVSPGAQLVLDVLEQTNDTGVVPKIGQRSVKYTDPKTKIRHTVKLTNEEFSQLQQRMGSLVSERLLKKEQYLSSPNINPDGKVKLIERILYEAGEKARNEFKKSNGYPVSR